MMLNRVKNNTYIIAEIGVNHNGKYKIAEKLVKIAKNCGADSVKFQIFNASDLSKKNAKLAPYQFKNLKKKISQFRMLKNLELKDKEYFKLYKLCKKTKIDFMCSVFDENSLNFYKKNFQDSVIKIPSGEITNHFLLNAININKSKVIISTGMSNLREIAHAINVLSKTKIYVFKNKKIKVINSKRLKFIKNKLFVLHCVSDYPTEKKYLNLRAIETMQDKLKLTCGFSDHTIGLDAAPIAVSKNSKIIEKHFTLDNKMKGPDHKCSLNPKQLKAYVEKIRETEIMLGQNIKSIQSCEKKNVISVRKSLVAKKDIIKGEIIRYSMLTAKRPANGISPMEFKYYINKKAKKNLKTDQNI